MTGATGSGSPPAEDGRRSWTPATSLPSRHWPSPTYEPIGLLRARRELTRACLPSAYVNVQLLINIVARVGLADTMTDQISTLLGRPPSRLVDYVRSNRQLWQPT